MGKNKNYDTAYKFEVCKRVEEGGESVAGLGRELGINENTLHSWLKRYRENKVTPFVGSGHIKPEDVEVKRLQRENRELREENEILKKAAAYFAKNQK
jgi:transposase